MTRINAKIRNADTIIPKNVTLSNVNKSDIDLENVDNTSDLNKPISTATQSALDLKANQSTTYTKTEVDENIAAIVDGAPSQLNTLNELAAALNDDENSIATLTAEIASKVSSTNPTISGTATFNGIVQMNDALTVNANVSANAFSGTIATNSQPSITSLGTLVGLTLGGDIDLSNNNIISGNSITATTLVGTLSATAQPNITSIGGTNGITIDGTITMGGNNIAGGGTVTANSFNSTNNLYQAGGISVLTNDTLGSSVVNSSLTSVGTLTSLTLGGDIDLGTNSITNVNSIVTSSLTSDSIEIDRIQSDGPLLIEPSTHNDITIQSGRDNSLFFADGTNVIISANRGVSGGIGGHIQIGGDTDTAAVYLGTTENDIQGGASSSRRVYVGSALYAYNDRVGIGTQAPSHTLEVVDDMAVIGDSPSITLRKTPADDTHESTRLAIGSDNSLAAFEIQTRDSDDTFISNDYRILKDSSGATNHRFAIANSTKLEVTSTGAAVTGNATISGDLTVSGTVTAAVSGELQTASQPNITGVGTISTGVWQGTQIADAYIASASTWNTVTGKQDSLTFGIADTNSVVIDATTNAPANAHYARFTASGIEGLSKADVLTDLGLSDGSTSLTINGLSADSANFTSVSTTDGTISATPANDTDITNKLYVDTQIASLVDSAPGTLDTLNELAAALGDDENFSTTVTDSLALKAPIDAPLFTNDLKVHGPIGGTGRIYIQDTDQGTLVGDSFLLAKSGKNAFVKNRQDGDLRFGTNDTDRMTIDADGKIGIGTTAPTAVFQILSSDGTAYSSNSDSGQRSAGSTLEITNESNTTNSFSQLLFGNRGANKAVTRIVSINTGTNSADLVFTTEFANTKRESMRINGAGEIGFGTSTPDSGYRVTVNGHLKGTGNIFQGGADYDLNDDARRTQTSNSDPSPAEPSVNTRRRALVHEFGDRLRLNYSEDYTGGVTIGNDFNFKNDGKLGINTNTPLAPLDVRGPNDNEPSIHCSGGILVENSGEQAPPNNRASALLSVSNSAAMVGGNIRLDDTNTTGSHPIYASHTDDRGGCGIVFYNSTDGLDGEMQFVRQNDTDDDTWTIKTSMVIKNQGDIGIGTTTPDERLHISTSSDTTFKVESGASNIGKIEFADNVDNRGYVEYDHATDKLIFGVDATDQLEITSNNISASTSISSTGTITSTSSQKRPIQNNEGDTNPVRNIRRMSQADYNTLVSNNDVDAFTFYIIV